MPKYLLRGTYSDAGFKGMVDNPSNRSDAIKQMTDALGITTECVYFSPTTGEAIMIMDSDAEKNARLMMIVMSSGTFSIGSLIELLDAEEMLSAMKDAGSLLGTYKPTNA